jgi:lipid-A-disaccharide synthase
MSGKPYILFCAGEDSGDSIGESLVRAVVAKGSFAALGAGGARMQTAGLQAFVDYEILPVSGFGDVLPRYFKLRRSFSELKKALESTDCMGLVAVDYPGFNMKLVRLAGSLRKPCLYVAPPQVWAWKSQRARELAQNSFVKLAVFFDFEENAYRSAGCDVVRVQHPFLSSRPVDVLHKSSLLLLPGSRKSQALRNLPLYLKMVQVLQKSQALSRLEVVLLAARQELVPVFEKALRQFNDETLLKNVQVKVTPVDAEERCSLYHGAAIALSAPGTATLELSLSGCPTVVCTKPDFLTYCLGSLFVKTKYFALPNIILDKPVYPELMVSPGQSQQAVVCCAQEMVELLSSKQNLDSSLLHAKLSVGKTLESLMAEFLRQFI